MYVDGLLAENHGEPPLEWDPRLAELRGTAPTPYDNAALLPDPPALPGRRAAPRLPGGLAARAHRDRGPDLVEKALGVDTTTRLQTAWQVQRARRTSAARTCATPLDDVPASSTAEPRGGGRLTTRTADVPGEPDPCWSRRAAATRAGEPALPRGDPPRRRLGGADRATFKWSRDNATVASRVTEIPARWTGSSSRASAATTCSAFSDGDWIEITDDVRELAGQAGRDAPDPGRRRRRRDDAVPSSSRSRSPAGTFPVDAQQRTIPARNTRVRRWDQAAKVFDAAGNELTDLSAASADGTIKIPTGATEVLLENGIVVTLPPRSPAGRSGR